MSRAVFYNLAPPSPARSAQVINRELSGLANAYRPRVLGACETIGHDLAPIPGYTLTRSRKTAGRANLAAYVREDCTVRRAWWVDMAQTWSRTEHPGTHPARSILVLGVGGAQVIVAHQAPQGTDNTHGAQLEAIDALTRLMSPWRRHPAAALGGPVGVASMKARPRLLLADMNRRPGEDGPGPDYLAHRIGGRASGTQIDCAVSRGVDVQSVEYVTHAGGVRLGTDHPWGAMVVHLGKGVRWS